jgi:DNA-binding transcriptional MerR regulator
MEIRIKRLQVSSIIDKYDLKRKSRTNKKCYQRAFIYKYLRNQGFSLKEIGDMFDRKHETVIHNLKIYEDMIITKNKDFEAAVFDVACELNEEKIFTEPLAKDIYEAIIKDDCSKAKEILFVIFKSITHVDYATKYEEFIEKNNN